MGNIYTIYYRSNTCYISNQLFNMETCIMESRNYIIILYDFYNTLFSDKQKLYFEEYYFNNLSLGEISDNYSLSRNAIHKIIKSMVEKLEYYEDKLKLYEKSIELTKIIDTLDKDTKEKISKLYLE